MIGEVVEHSYHRLLKKLKYESTRSRRHLNMVVLTSVFTTVFIPSMVVDDGMLADNWSTAINWIYMISTVQGIIKVRRRYRSVVVDIMIDV